MIKLRIDDQIIEVQKGTTIYKAAKQANIDIPTMCFGDKTFTNHPSCMICVVKEKSSAKLLPSCAYPVFDGMEIITDDEEIRESRKEALELLLSDHAGDCEAPCRTACPANMNIALMNRLIAEGKFDEAIKVVKKDIAFPFILGYICSAPCEKVCRRKDADQAVSICMLKRFVAKADMESQNAYIAQIQNNSTKKVAIIGAGLSGLTAAYHSAINGHQVTLYEKEKELGGTLSNLPENELPKEVLNAELALLKKLNIEFIHQAVDKSLFNSLMNKFDAIIIATGSKVRTEFNLNETEKGIQINKDTFQTNQERVFACGSAVQPIKMAIRALAQGKNAANSVNKFLLENKYEKNIKPFNSKIGKLLSNEIEEYLKEAINRNEVAPNNDFFKGFIEKEAIIEAQRCMHCDCRKLDNCKLRDYATIYEANQKEYRYGNRKEIRKLGHHNSIIYEPEKCIKCGLCIEIAKKYNEAIGLTYIGRGFDVKIDIPFNYKLENALSKASEKCVELCPTGAMAFK